MSLAISSPNNAGAVARHPTRAVCAAISQVPLLDKPIPPDWVRSGTPRARCGEHSIGPDGWASTVHWDCTAGSFNWTFGWEETVHILEGEVRVTDAEGHTQTLRVGDVGFFPPGSTFLWEVDHYVRKLAFVRRPVPGYAQRLGALRDTLAAFKQRILA